jgi:sugar lactone lactonase YvrE
MVVVSVLLTIGGIAATPGRAAAAGADPAGTIYVSDYGTSTIDVFAPGATGNVAPIRTISGGLTGIDGPGDVKVSSAGDIYISNFNSDSITEYAPGASGNVAPTCTISGSNTGLDGNDDMSLASDGTLYVGNDGSSTVVVFAPGACGNVTPLRTIAGALTGLNDADGVGADAAGTIYAASSYDGVVQIFAPGANGNVAPTSSIGGSLTGLGLPDDVVVGFAGDLYVSDANASVETFSPGASGNVAPLTSIAGSNTDMGDPDDLAVDASGNIYVTDSASTVGPALLEYASGATGNVAPIATIDGSLTTFVEPEGAFVTGPPVTSSASLTSAASASSISLGASAHDTATLSGGTTPTGSIIFKLFGPSDPTCSAAPAYTSPLSTVTGDGPYVSPSFTPIADGTYSWVDLYSGDAKNTPVSTACGDPAESLTVTTTVQPTTVSTSLSGGGQSGTSISVPTGTAVTDAATLAGANASTAGGTVTYGVFSDNTCATSAGSGGTVTVTDGAVPASSAVTLASPGPYYWQASYSGDSANQPSQSLCTSEVETVTGGPPPPPNTCTGSLAVPGVLAGLYKGDVTITGYCVVDGGRALITGDLTLAPGAALNATFALNDVAGSGTSSLLVRGDIKLGSGATLAMGCEPNHSPCTDDPNAGTGGTLRGSNTVDGSLIAKGALGVIVHASRIKGSVRQTSGGGGLSCAPPTTGIFSVLGSPVFSDYEDNNITGSLRVLGIQTCWFGALRNTVHQNLTYNRNTLGDPDGSEVNSNVVFQDIGCSRNSPAVQFGDATMGVPNKVGQHASGQCSFKTVQPNPAPSGPLTHISVKKK